MAEQANKIFREKAIQRYAQGQEQATLPKLVTPHVFFYLWVLLVLLGAMGIVAGLVHIPVYVTGTGIVQWQESQGQIVLVAFLPPETLPFLAVGQKSLIQVTATGERWHKPIMAIEPDVLSASVAQKRFDLGASSDVMVNQPTAVATIQLEPVAGSLPATAYVGSVYVLEIQIGTRRAISLLPFIGQLFQG